MAFPGKTVLVTNFKPIPPGTDGGISLYGTLAAYVGAITVAAAALLSGLVTPKQAAVIVLAGFLGTMVDSLLGSLFERKGWLNNDLVNLLSTAAAAGLAWAFA
jgi:uncharacterized protein (TIGR00297 family)